MDLEGYKLYKSLRLTWEGQLVMIGGSESPWTWSVSGAAPLAVAAPSASVSISVSWARSSIPWARPVTAAEVKKEFDWITTRQLHVQYLQSRWYSFTLSFGGHRALSSVLERLASGAWSYRNLHGYILCQSRNKQVVDRELPGSNTFYRCYNVGIVTYIWPRCPWVGSTPLKWLNARD